VGAIAERDQIAALTRDNRRRRDAAIETRLVRARHDAFWELDRVPARRRDLDRVADDPVGAGSPREIDQADLTPALLASAIRRHGSIIVRGLASTARASQLLGDVDRAFAARAAHLNGAAVEETAPWYAPFEPDPRCQPRHSRRLAHRFGAVYTGESPATLFDLLETFEENGVRRLLSEHLREPPVLALSKCALRRVSPHSGSAWHQEVSLFGPDARTCNVWLALTACGVDAPSVEVVPFRLDAVGPTGGLGAPFDWAVAPAAVDRILGGRPRVLPAFAPGDALLFDDLCLHRTGVGPGMRHERSAIETWFFAASTFPSGQVPLLV
jgi:hypothetical protein